MAYYFLIKDYEGKQYLMHTNEMYTRPVACIKNVNRLCFDVMLTANLITDDICDGRYSGIKVVHLALSVMECFCTSEPESERAI